jgi:hypothetical protein
LLDDLTDRVLGFVVEQTGVRREKLNLDSRLSFDLGIEGDDAVEFFEQFRARFSVDLEELGDNWNSYFAPEGVTLTTAAIVLAPAFVLGIGFSVLFPRWPTWVCWLLGFALYLVGFFIWITKFRRPGPDEITVAELVRGAECGRLRLSPTLEKTPSILPNVKP